MNIIFAGGGTGGHLIAGLSIAQKISSRFPGANIIFFGTSKEGESGYIGKRAMSLNKLRHVSLHRLFAYLPLSLFP